MRGRADFHEHRDKDQYEYTDRQPNFHGDPYSNEYRDADRDKNPDE